MFERFKNRPADPDSTATTSRDRPAGNGRAHGTERPTGAATRREETGERTRDQMRATRARQREEYGGVNWGAAFFGWLVAVGLGSLLVAIVAAAGAAVGLTQVSGSEAEQNAESIGLGGAIVLLVVLMVAYYCGGYVAGRMARFDGMKQGIAVWVWALVIAILVAILGAVAGSEFNILAQLNAFPRIPVSEGDLATGGIIAAIAVVLASLVGAILGGLAGMRFHRKVDKTGLGS